ncbi:MAG: hypothetical protein QF541_15215, partial [Lentisphaeria bacterium]|nr:hypothetical protein [Lentisphaeria bacterium]
QLTPGHKTSAYGDYKLARRPREVMKRSSRAQYPVLFNPAPRIEYEEDFSLGGNKPGQAAGWRNATRKVEYGAPVSRALATNPHHDHSVVKKADFSTGPDTQ